MGTVKNEGRGSGLQGRDGAQAYFLEDFLQGVMDHLEVMAVGVGVLGLFVDDRLQGLVEHAT